MNKKVYLAGPISGCSYAGCTSWRDDVAKMFPLNVECLSPMRAKEALRAVECLTSEQYGHHFLCSDKEVLGRDFNDCQNADVILVNFLGAAKPSIGTCMEIAWGYQLQKPVVLVMEPDNVHSHPMIRAASNFIYGSITEAVHATCAILNTKPLAPSANSR